MRDLLNELHERGIFKQLHVHFPLVFLFKQETVDHLISFNGLTNLEYTPGGYIEDLSHLVTVKHISLPRIIRFNRFFLSKLVNLESIEFTCLYVHNILLLIRYLPNLNTIVVRQFEVRHQDYITNFKIEKLNKERSKLVNARKIIIYVSETVYLTAKWAKNGTKQSLIEIKRLASYDAWNKSFYPTFPHH